MNAEPSSTESKRPAWKNIVFWIATGLIVVSQFASGVLDWMKYEEIAKGILSLGYPEYLMYILGTCKIAGAIVLAIPGFKRLKEWAYAGFVFDFGGAFASHALNGDSPGEMAPPLIALVILLASYFLCPPGRKI